MKKTIKRFWGVGLIVIILSSLFVAPMPVSAGNYSFSGDVTVPSATNLILGPAGGFGIYDVDQTADGSTIYLVGEDAALVDYLYKSTNGGTTWTRLSATNLAAGTWDFIAVAPDNASVLIVGNSVLPQVYLSVNGGATFSSLGYAGASINDLDVSPQSGPFRYMGVGSNDGVYVWNYGATVPAWTNTFTSVAWTDINYTAATASGVVTAALGPDTVTATYAGFTDVDATADIYDVAYLDQDGVASTGTLTIPVGGGTVALALAAGDTGVFDITNITLGAGNDATAGTFSLASDTTSVALGTCTFVPVFTDGAAVVDAVADSFTVTYLDQNNNASTGTVTFPAYSVAGATVAVTLAAGDTGIVDVTAIAVATSDITAGVFNIVGTSGIVLGTWTVTGAGTGTFTDGSYLPAVQALAFSTSFASDQSMLFVTALTNSEVTLHVGSFNTRTFDGAVDATFPRVLEAGTTLVCARADIALDPAFYLGDEATQIGFVGADITGVATAQIGGIYRISTYTAGGTPVVYTLTQIQTGTAIRSVAWDGTNLVAAQNVLASGAPLSIYRSANALSSGPPTFLLSATAKTPGTGFAPIVIWNGTNVLCFSQGTNAGVARSMDLGRAFNGIALLNTTWAAIPDAWVSPDASVIYLLADDGTDLNLWRKMSGAWERVYAMAGRTGEIWLVRASASDTTAVVLGYYANPNMFISTNSGETSWTARSASVSIQDFAVETKDIVYVAAFGNNTVIKSSNGAFTWGTPVNTNLATYGGGNCYSLTLVSAGNVLVGGDSGGVAYSTDSAATFTGMRNLSTGANLETMAVASGLTTGDTIYAVDSVAGGRVYKWVIGTNTTAWTAGQVMRNVADTATDGIATGITLYNGVLYVFDDLNNVLWRFLEPATTPGFTAASDKLNLTKAFTNASAASGGVSINALQASSGSTKVWAHSLTTLESLTDYLATAADAPKLTFPTDGYLLQVNSLSGAPNAFVFQWTSPAATAPPTPNYNYNVQVYLDAAGMIGVGGSDTAAELAAATSATSLSAPSNLTGTFFPIPGTTYYWRVRVDANTPVQSHWSGMRTLTVQPLAALVPALASPANGSTIKNQSPAFSWSPVTSTTKYEFQLSTTPTFGTTVLTDTPATAGALVPVTIKLEKGKQYFWRVRALEPVQGDWSTVANFVVAVDDPTQAPPVTVTVVPAPVITIPAAPAAPTYTLAPPAVEEIAPTYIWAIIIIGAILVIAVIVLIVRTRRSV